MSVPAVHVWVCPKTQVGLLVRVGGGGFDVGGLCRPKWSFFHS